MVGQPRRPSAGATVDAPPLRRSGEAVASFRSGCDGAVDMIRCLLTLAFALCALSAPASNRAWAKDELVLAMTQTPGTWNPLISSMLAKSLVANMTARPLTAYDADWKLVCLACTELPTLQNGKARVMELIPDQIITRQILAEPKRENGQVVSDTKNDILKIAVIERHHKTGNIGLGLTKGFGLRSGAIAGSVGHDAHNINVVGTNDADTAVR